jgi:hypothetical protein
VSKIRFEQKIMEQESEKRQSEIVGTRAPSQCPVIFAILTRWQTLCFWPAKRPAPMPTFTLQQWRPRQTS